MEDKEINLHFTKAEDPLIFYLHQIIIYFVKALAILMVFVIFAILIDVVLIVYDHIIVQAPFGGIHVEGILTVLGAFIAVLISIEIFNNIVVYIKSESIHAKLVLSTALIAISRKVIILDYKNTPPETIYAIATIVLATALAYWVVSYKTLLRPPAT